MEGKTFCFEQVRLKKLFALFNIPAFVKFKTLDENRAPEKPKLLFHLTLTRVFEQSKQCQNDPIHTDP